MVSTDAYVRTRKRSGHTRRGVMLYELLQNILHILHEALWNVAQPRMRACDCT